MQVRIIFISLFLIASIAVFSQNKKTDTMFLLRENKAYYHSIFIDKKNSRFYDDIFKNISVNSSTYDNALKELKDSARIKHFTIPFSEEWISVHQWKNKLYAYDASESYYNLYLKFSDSTLSINYFNDGLLPAIIEEIVKRDERTYFVKLKGLYNECSEIVFHFLSDKKNRAIVEFPLSPKQSRYSLMASRESIKTYPIIVNYSPENRVDEWKFETPDYEQMLRSVKKTKN